MIKQRAGVAAVTGGGRGVGAAIARALAAEGFAVAVLARTDEEVDEVARSIAESGGAALAVTCDVTSQKAVLRAFRDVSKSLGDIDVLVNNAGRAHAVGLPWAVDVDDWWTDVEVNLRGPFLWSHAVMPGMIARRRGCIVNVVSLAAMTPYPYALAYSVAKAALMRLTDSLAVAVREFGIDVFAISPGLVRTALLSDMADSDGGRQLLPEFQTKSETDYDPPEAAGELVATLASGRASALSGRFIHVSHNLEEMIADADSIVARDFHVLRLQMALNHPEYPDE